MSHLVQMNEEEEEDTVPLIENLEMQEIFKDEDREEEASVTDLIY